MAKAKSNSHTKARQADLTGQRFGRLVVLSYAGRYRWHCQCDCGKAHCAKTCHLKSGAIKSCGCLRQQTNSKVHRTHGLSKTPEYRCWKGIKRRCYGTQTRGYPLYGGRGIRMCDRWRDSFVAFLEDMGLRPSPRHTIDRIDVNGPYSPENCRWATCKEQQNNRRDTLFITFRGETLSLKFWAQRLGIKSINLYQRLYLLGWSVERAFRTPDA